jgi:putative tryptophan/tyrosine transport system substrate-binding protein
MRRREFTTLLGGAAVSWPIAARAEQPKATRRIEVLMNRTADDLQGQAGAAAFQQSLQQLGWSNVRIDTRWGGDDVDRERRYADELIALAPDIILAAGSMSVMALQHVTRTLPIVFVGVVDPVGTGFVDALARPGGNTTGFMLFEYSLSVKWLELLKQIVPSMTRAAVLRNPANPAAIAEFVAIRSAGQQLGVEVSPINVQVANEIERAVAAFAQSTNGGLILTGSASVSVHRNLIIALAAKYKQSPGHCVFQLLLSAQEAGCGSVLSRHLLRWQRRTATRRRHLPIAGTRRRASNSILVSHGLRRRDVRAPTQRGARLRRLLWRESEQKR